MNKYKYYKFYIWVLYLDEVIVPGIHQTVILLQKSFIEVESRNFWMRKEFNIY